MLWNWETIDACFLTEKWRIRSYGGFAGLCIGVILIVVLLEALRRAAKVYDQYLAAQHRRAMSSVTTTTTTTAAAATMAAAAGDDAGRSDGSGSLIAKGGRRDRRQHESFDPSCPPSPLRRCEPFRPNVWQQAVRALLHALQFAVAYWVMLLAMYYNGFVIICIIIGSFIGAFVFQWERIGAGGGSDQ